MHGLQFFIMILQSCVFVLYRRFGFGVYWLEASLVVVVEQCRIDLETRKFSDAVFSASVDFHAIATPEINLDHKNVH